MYPARSVRLHVYSARSMYSVVHHFGYLNTGLAELGTTQGEVRGNYERENRGNEIPTIVRNILCSAQMEVEGTNGIIATCDYSNQAAFPKTPSTGSLYLVANYQYVKPKSRSIHKHAAHCIAQCMSTRVCFEHQSEHKYQHRKRKSFQFTPSRHLSSGSRPYS